MKTVAHSLSIADKGSKEEGRHVVLNIEFYLGPSPFPIFNSSRAVASCACAHMQTSYPLEHQHLN